MNRTALLDRTSTGRLEDLGQQLRVDSVRASAAANSGHPTSSLSAADLMAVLLARHFRYDFANPHAAGNDHLIDVYSVKPIDAVTLRQAARETRRIITVEDHWAEGR